MPSVPTFPAAFLAAALTLAACASVAPGTAARLAALDPVTADPAAIEVALLLPPGLQVAPGTAVLTLAASRGDQRLSGDFRLQPRPAPGVAPPAGGSVAAFGLAPADLPRMRDLQAGIAGWRDAGAAQGSLSVGVGGCALGSGPDPDATGAVLLRLAPDAPFRPLIRPTRLADLLGPEMLAAIAPCGGAQ